MAIHDSESPSHSSARVSPGDAVFERLKQREALRAKGDAEAPPSPVSTIFGTEFVGPPVMPRDWAPPANPGAALVPPAASAESAAPEALVSLPPPAESSTAGQAASAAVIDEAPAAEPVDRVLAVAAALGIDVAPSAPAPVESVEPATASIGGPARPGPSADATAARLEAALLDQLKSLEETLIDDVSSTPAQMPRAEPLRLPKVAAQAPDVVGPPRRSVFAPDPVRQRTYVDLRSPVPVGVRAASDDPPWRKYLAEPRRRDGVDRARSPRPAMALQAARTSPAAAASHDRNAEAEERGRGIRAMSAAAVLGLGVGLGLLVLIRPFTDSGISSVAAPGVAAGAPVVAAAPRSTEADATAPSRAGTGSPVNRALATLLADPPGSHAAVGRTAVISEPGPVAATSLEAPAPATAIAAAAEPPIVIRPAPGEAQQLARVPDFDAAQPGPLAYVPAIPSYDPVRQSLLEEEQGAPEPQPATRAPVARSAGTAVSPESGSVDIRPGRATINGFVNLRANPDNAAPVVAILAEGLSVKVIGCDYWCEVEAGGKRGFVFKKFVSR